MSYTREDIHLIVEKQREFFNTGKTLDVKFRKAQLKKLKAMILDNQDKIAKALHEDLGRSEMESYLCDIGPTVMVSNSLSCASRALMSDGMSSPVAV